MEGLPGEHDFIIVVEEVANGSSEYDDDGGVGAAQRRIHLKPQTSLGMPCLPAIRIVI